MASYIGSTGLTYLWNKIKAVFATKQDTLVSGTNIKTINSQSLLGSGDISVSGAPAVIEMKVIRDADGSYNTPTFIDAGEAYDIVVANGDNIIVRMQSGYMDGDTAVYDEVYLYFDLAYYDSFEGDYFLGFHASDGYSSFALGLASDEGGSEELVVANWAENAEHLDDNVIQCNLDWPESLRYGFLNRYEAYYNYQRYGKAIKFTLQEGTRDAHNAFVPNGNEYPLKITYISDTGNIIVCSSYSSEKKYTFVLGVDSANNQLTIEEVNIEDPIETVKVNGSALTPDANKAVDITVPTESTVSGWGFTKNAGTITGINVAGVSKGTSGVVDVGVSEVNHGTSDTTFTLTPNVMHIWGTVSSLTLSLPTDSNSYLDEYLFTFTSGSTPTTLSLPSTVKWVQDIEVEANKTYQVSIINNLAGWLTNGMPSGGGSGGGGENNVIESISVNSVAQTVDANKNVNLQFKTINNESISGTGNISVSGGSSHIVEMTASWDANDEYLENFTFSNPSSDYTKFTEHGSEVIVIVSTGVMENGTFVPDDYYYYTNIVWDNNSSSWGITFWDNNEKYSITVNSQNQILAVNNERHETVGGGEENVIETVKVNGSALTPDANKAVDVSVPTESTVSDWGFTKNTGTYSKPSGGIPKTDLATAVQTSLGLADTALQSYTETDPIFAASAAHGITSSDISNWNSKTSNVGTITGITMNGTSKGTSGVVDLGTVITAHQDISSKADKATTLAGYGITDTYTKTEANSHFWSLDTASSTSITATSDAPVDLNDYTTPGTYVSSSTSTYQYVSNLPSDFSTVPTVASGATFRLYVFKNYSTGNTLKQRIENTRASRCNVWERVKYGTIWNNWILVQDDLSNKPNIYSGSSAPSGSTGSNGDIYIQTS